MRIPEFFTLFELHDSGVDHIIYSPGESKLVLQIKLCNYMQEGYKEGEPELTLGKLVFSDVQDFKADPSLDAFEWGDNASGDISSSGYIPERDTQGLEAAEFVILMDNYRSRQHDVLIVSFLGSNVEWQPAL